MKTYFKKQLKFGILFLGTLLLQFCSKENTEETDLHVNQNSELLEIFKRWGFSKEDIKEYPNSYVVSGDIVFYKNKTYLSPYDDNNSKKLYSENKKGKQKAYPISVTINNINVYLNPGMDSNWISASVEAINRWNSVNCSTLNLMRVFNINDADIEILFDTDETDLISYPFVPLSLYQLGKADWPSQSGSDGIPGRKIWINPDVDFFNGCGFNINQSNRIANVQHELGHNLGLTHLNDPAGIQIPNTPFSDSESIMKGSAACTINDFSNADKIAVKFLFPCLPDPFSLNWDYGTIPERSSDWACATIGSGSEIYYFLKLSIWELELSDVIYIDRLGHRLNGNNKWINIGRAKAFKIDTNGVIVAISHCGIIFES
ncbi:hypothetical protein MBM09_03140 [Flaviramulus sp. BrNp1-15]|uniref:matrixin family metalloprotease n=1 Tax=Flaviramulus sp. BrNp1-15 TaxID=2916754 RepID=UPI001EE80051|nr:matrixin family metalloprotease [Flaviramulus sp. BrNp1-15]ULC59986.1 hypothetical protein MBM09_03140 [Flaviramulus sp. BrNp1-15]